MSEINKDIAATIAEVDGDEADVEVVDNDTPSQPIFKKFEDSAIRVSKAHGTIWRSRMDQAKSRMKSLDLYDTWDEAVAYYRNDQTGRGDATDPQYGQGGVAKKRHGRLSENIVFSNVSTIVPTIYAKNPSVTVTSTHKDEEMARKQAGVFERLINSVLQERSAPGVNLKPKVRRCVVMTSLTNISYLETGYVLKEESSQDVFEKLQEINEKLEKAKPEEVRELEGELLALEEKIDLLSPSGPFVKLKNPKDVLIDPDAELGDLSDAKWIMIREVMMTSYINAVFRRKKEGGEDDAEGGVQYENIYKPSHVVKVDSESRDIAGHDDEINSFSLLNNEDDPDFKKFGYDGEDSFRKAQRTVCWWVWDKLTRRVLLFAEHDWTWPIWVWDDPYGYKEFFPLDPLSFHTDPIEQFARGEVSYYLEQQDEINKINNAIAQYRQRMLSKVIANSRVVKEDLLKAFLRPGNEEEVLVVDFDPALELSKALTSLPMPADAASLLNKDQLYASIDRISSVSPLMKGVEFKTNTTNKAIESYESSTATRLDEKIDAIEELIGRVGSKILHNCLQFMDVETVQSMIGPFEPELWQNYNSDEANKTFKLQIVGGSTLKPTSKVRKEQAVALGQVLGQFASATPAAIIVMLKIFQRAYGNEIDITDNDWAMLIDTIQQQLQRGNSSGGGGGEGGAPSPEQQGGGASPQDVVLELSNALEQAPDELKQQVGTQIAQGVPLAQIVEQLMAQ